MAKFYKKAETLPLGEALTRWADTDKGMEALGKTSPGEIGWAVAGTVGGGLLGYVLSHAVHRAPSKKHKLLYSLIGALGGFGTSQAILNTKGTTEGFEGSIRDKMRLLTLPEGSRQTPAGTNALGGSDMSLAFSEAVKPGYLNVGAAAAGALATPLVRPVDFVQDVTGSRANRSTTKQVLDNLIMEERNAGKNMSNADAVASIYGRIRGLSDPQLSDAARTANLDAMRKTIKAQPGISDPITESVIRKMKRGDIQTRASGNNDAAFVLKPSRKERVTRSLLNGTANAAGAYLLASAIHGLGIAATSTIDYTPLTDPICIKEAQ